MAPLPLAPAMLSVSANKALLSSPYPNTFELSAVSLLFLPSLLPSCQHFRIPLSFQPCCSQKCSPCCPTLPFPHLKYHCFHGWQSCSAPPAQALLLAFTSVFLKPAEFDGVVMIKATSDSLSSKSVPSHQCKLSRLKHGLTNY